MGQLQAVEPEVKLHEEKAMAAFTRKANTIQSLMAQQALLKGDIHNTNHAVQKEQSKKAVELRRMQQERQMKVLAEREQKRQMLQSVDRKSEAEQKYDTKKHEITQSQELLSVKQQISSLKDKIDEVKRMGRLRLARLNFNSVRDKAAAEKKGLKELSDFKRQVEVDRQKATTQGVSKALDKVGAQKDNSMELKGK